MPNGLRWRIDKLDSLLEEAEKLRSEIFDILREDYEWDDDADGTKYDWFETEPTFGIDEILIEEYLLDLYETK